MHGHRLDAELAAGAQDAERDLAPIGDYDFVEHGLRVYSMTNSGWPNSTGSPFVAMIAVTLPDLVALDLVHHLHRFDDAEDLAFLDLGADLDEGLRAGRGGRIEGAHHRRGDDVFVRMPGGGGGRGGARGRRGGDGSGDGGDRRLHHLRLHVGHVPAGRHAADSHRFLTFLDLDFGDPRFLE